MKWILLALLAVVTVACSSASEPTLPVQTSLAPQPPMNSDCRPGDPLAGVYHPSRLGSCQTVTGTVTRIKHEKDGDYHINVQLDVQFANLLNDANRTKQDGTLVVEIIPADQTRVHLPKAGDYVKVTGPYVLDKDHGWMEIHPVWVMRVLK